MKDITVIDNFISDDEFKEACKIINKDYPDDENWFDWYFNDFDNCWKKNLYDIRNKIVYDSNSKIESVNIDGDDIFACALTKNFVLKMKNRIEKYTKMNFKIVRAYLNRQSYGEDAPIHIDDKDSNAYTFLIYLGDITPENFDKVGGILEFKNKENTKIEPFSKRAVIFRSNIPHCPFGPLIPGITRISLAIKFVDSLALFPFIVRYT